MPHQAHLGMTEVLRIQLQAAIHVLQHQQYGVVVKIRNLDFASLNLHSSRSTPCLLVKLVKPSIGRVAFTHHSW